MPAKKLNARMRAFVQEFVWGVHAGDASKCSRAAGFAAKDAASYGYQTRHRPAVKAAIEKEQAKKLEQLKGEGVFVAQVQRWISTADIADLHAEDGSLLPIRDIPREARVAIAGIEYEPVYEGEGEERQQVGTRIKSIKFRDSKASAELFLKWNGELKDKIEVEGWLTLDQLVPRRKPPEET